jgi:nicotinamidase-related amidase
MATEARQPPWLAAIPETDLAVYRAAGYGERVEPGRRPALLVIDVTYGFVGREPLPILDSVAEYPNSCGERGWDAVGAIGQLLQASRARGIDTYYTAGTSEAPMIGRWRDKHPRTLNQPPDAFEIVAEIAPSEGDVVIEKTKPSAFHGTPLLGALIDQQTDTLIVAGCTTSGCVRAAVVDAFSYGFRVIVAEETVFDRGELSHAVNLFDMNQKYANVEPLGNVVAYLQSVERPT